MEGLVLSTAFISFAILAWLVIAKFGGPGSGSASSPAGGGGGGGNEGDDKAAAADSVDRPSSLSEQGGVGGGVGGMGGSDVVDVVDNETAAVDMPDDADEEVRDVLCDTKTLNRPSPVDMKRMSVEEDVGDESSGGGGGTPASNRRLSRRQRKNNRKREKEEKDKNNGRKCLAEMSTSCDFSTTRLSLSTTSPSPTITAYCLSTPDSPNLSFSLSASKNKKRSGAPCRQYEKLGLQDYQIYQCLVSYKLEEDQLRRLGFPMESELHPGKACVYQDPEFVSKSVGDVDDDDYRDEEQRSRIGSRSSSLLDVNAREFYPGSCSSLSSSGKSPPQLTSVVTISHPQPVLPAHAMDVENQVGVDGIGDKTEEDNATIGGASMTSSLTLSASLQHSASTSSVLSASAKEFVPSFRHNKTDALSVPTSTTATSGKASSGHVSEAATTTTAFFVGDGCESKQCTRCGKLFNVTSDGQYLTQEGCTYHWGKLRAKRRKDRWPEDDRFTCCGAPASEAGRGCCQCRLHVWRTLTDPGMHGPLDGFIRTRPKKCYPVDGNYGIYSMDGEMCFTTNGLELIKLTVVGVDGRLVYESLVLPEGDIVDYNTRFSGISARDLKRGPAKTLREVQNDVMGFVNAHTILIGHGLENDLRALKIIHTSIIDTSIVFPHYYGLPYRRSLKSLVKSYLKRDIQAASWGHDSYEDARACVELMLWKVRKDLPIFGAKMKDEEEDFVTSVGAVDSAGFFTSHEFAAAGLSGIHRHLGI